MKVASYNIKGFRHKNDRAAVLEAIRAVDADLVGIQEVDCDTERCGPGNQVRIIAEALGYPYWYFCKTIKYKGGGYGHGVVSRYPILSSQAVDYAVIGENDRDGNRNFERHVLDVNGRTLVFYNTHLTLDKPSQAAELEQLFATMAEDEACVLTGDFNAQPDLLASNLDEERFAMLNQGIPTFPEGENSRVAIDNIIISRNLLKDASITVHKAECSDHNMIYSEIDF